MKDLCTKVLATFNWHTKNGTIRIRSIESFMGCVLKIFSISKPGSSYYLIDVL